MPRQKGLRVLLYARASSRRQAEKGLSVPGQLRELRHHCVQHGYRIVKEFKDEGYSGTTDRRPAFQKMIVYAEENPDQVDAILVWSFSRFARNREYAVVYKAKLRKLGIKVMSVTEPMTDGPEAELVEGVLEAIDAHRSKALARDVIRGMREAANQGFYPLSTVPIGYRREPVRVGKAKRYKLVPDEKVAPIVRLIFRQYTREGKGAKEIAQELNSRGFRTPRGGSWDRNTILRIISNPIYIGTLVVQFTTDNAMYLPPEEREIILEGFCPPLVDRENFEAAQRNREERARAHPQHLASNYMLSGLAYCARCGAKLIGVPAKGGRYHYYACSTYWNRGKSACDGGMINQALLDSVVLEKVRRLLLDEVNVERLVVETNHLLGKERAQLMDERKVLTHQLRQARVKLKRLLDLAESGFKAPAALCERIEQRQRDVSELEDRISKLDFRIENVEATEIDATEVVRYVTFLREWLQHCPVRRQRAILGSFIRKISVSRDAITIEYTIPRPMGKELDLKDLDRVPILGPPGTPGRI